MPNIIRRGSNSQGNEYIVYGDFMVRHWHAIPYGYSGTSVDDGYGSDGTYDSWHQLIMYIQIGPFQGHP